MSDLQNDSDVVNNGRKNVLKDNEETGLQVTASLRDQQIEKLAKKLDKMQAGHKISNMWRTANSERREWLMRQDQYLLELDEFIDPIYEPSTDWSSTLHLPTILTVVKTFHSRFMAALTSIDPPFTVKPRKASTVDRAMLVQELMRYTLKDWANYNQGVENALDLWLWDWVARGCGILKARWDKKFVKFMDIEEIITQGARTEFDPQTGQTTVIPTQEIEEVEIERVIEKFNGPVLERAFVEDVVIIGGEGDPQQADAVIQSCWYTASELWTFVDQKIFSKKVVEEIISGGSSRKSSSEGALLKQRQVETAGTGSVDKESDLDRYEILEAYVQMDIDGSGINSDLIVWVHEQSMKIVRATYLHRVMRAGMRPFFKIDFHKRHGVEYGVGLVELLYSLGKEIDAMHNLRLDVGILTSIPFGFYRPTSSTLKEEKLDISPGSMIPLDDPQRDVYYPNLGNRVSFGFQEESALQQQVERLTSISDMNLGIISGQGAARTATGARAIIGEGNANLDIFLKRMNRGWKQALKYMFCQLQDKLPDGFQFRLLGDDGNLQWKEIPTRQELQGMFDFELEGNSANSNPQMQLEQANLLYQMTGNPMDLQLGIISPLERYNAVVSVLKANKIHDFSKYVRKPQGIMTVYTPLEIANRVLDGMPFQLDPTQDLQGFIDLVQLMISEDEMNGQLDQFQLAALIGKAQEAQGLLESLQQQEAQQTAAQQQQMNTQAAMTPGNMPAVGVTEG